MEERGSKRVNPLEITENEKKALLTYAGIRPRNTCFETISKEKESYGMLNSMFFEGIDNELIRMMDDGKHLPIHFIRKPDEMMQVITLLYSAMYKYGKIMSTEKTGYRVERLQSMLEISKRGTTISNFSTSAYKYDRREFDKKEMILLEVHIQPGTPCVDFQKVLSYYEYHFYDEAEILVAPFCPVKIEQMLKEEGLARYKVTVSTPEKAKPLTSEELEHKGKMTAKYKDKVLQEKAFEVLSKMLDFMYSEYPDYNSQIGKEKLTEEEIKDYTEWKSAFLEVVKYRFREIELEIEAALEAQEQHKKEDILTLSEQNTAEINHETIGKMLETTVITGNIEIQTENKSIGEQ